jgi:hypothetical protein
MSRERGLFVVSAVTAFVLIAVWSAGVRSAR